MSTSDYRTADATLIPRLLNTARQADPYPEYAALRAAGPVIRLPDAPVAIITGYAECLALLEDPRISSDHRRSALTRTTGERSARSLVAEPAFAFLDPPDHTRLRHLAGKAFTARAVDAVEPFIRETIDGLLSDVGDLVNPVDLLAELAYPLPLAVICRLMGVPVADEPLFGRLLHELSRSADPVVALGRAFGTDPDSARIGASAEFRASLTGLVEQRRRTPGTDLLSALITAEDAGDMLSEDELVTTARMLMTAGHDTMVNLIGNGMLALLRTRSQWDALAADPSLAPAVVEETLRYDPPVQIAVRVAGADLEVGGVPLSRGTHILLLLGAAQRDPAAAEAPDDFDVTRPRTTHLAFAHGIHFCLGAPLARLEGGLVFRRIAQRLVGVELADLPQYDETLTQRGMSSLPVNVDRIRPATVPW